MAGWLNTSFFEFDRALFVFAHNLFLGAGNLLTPLFKAITFLGNGGWFFIVLGIVLLLFKKTRKTGVALLLSIACGAIFTNLILKNSVARLRPYVANEEYRSFWQSVGGKIESEYSFPSGHTTVTMASMMAIFLSSNKKWSWLGFVFAIIMGLTRIYFTVHYATDVIAGLIVGALAGGIGYYLLKIIFNAIEINSDNKFCHFILNADITKLFRKSK